MGVHSSSGSGVVKAEGVTCNSDVQASAGVLDMDSVGEGVTWFLAGAEQAGRITAR